MAAPSPTNNSGLIPFSSLEESSLKRRRSTEQPLTPVEQKTSRVASSQSFLTGLPGPFPATSLSSRSSLAGLPNPFSFTSSSSSSSSSVGLLCPVPLFTAPASFSLSQGAALEMASQRKVCPEGPRKIKSQRSFFGSEPTCHGYTLKHFTEPSIKDNLELIPLASDGQYKKAWRIPEGKDGLIPGTPNSDLLILIFKDNDHNATPSKVYGNMQSSINQYDQAVERFGEDRCVHIFNAATALEDGYFIVKKIDLSLEDVLKTLHSARQFTSMEQLTALNADETILLDLLAQIKKLFDLSLECRIDTDLHVGNFRLERKETEFRLLLTDFREEIDDDDLAINKRTEIRNLKTKLASFFSPQFIDHYFQDTISNIESYQKNKSH